MRSEERQVETERAAGDESCGLTTQEEVSRLFGGFQVIRPEGGRAAGIMELTGMIKYTTSGVDEKAGKQGE